MAPRAGARSPTWVDGVGGRDGRAPPGRHRAQAAPRDELRDDAVAPDATLDSDRRRHPRRRPRRPHHELQPAASSRCGGCPEDVLESRDDDAALGLVARASSPIPTRSSPRSRSSTPTPRRESHDTIEFHDGRVFERLLDAAAGRRRDRRPGVELPRRHRARAARGRARPPGVPRPADRPRQPGAVPRPRRARARPRSTEHRRRARGAVHRPRRLQDRQRQPRPRRRRRAARRRGGPAPALPAAGDTAARLGGDEFAVLLEDLDDADEADRPSPSGSLDALRSPFGSPATRSSSAPASASPFGDRRRSAATSCCATPTSPCTRPSAGARTASSCSRRRCTRPRSSASSSRPTCAAALDRGELRPPLPADRRASDGGRVAGVEALVRWQHPTRGLLAPDAVHPARRGDRPHRRARPPGARRRLPRRSQAVAAGLPDGRAAAA